MERDFDGEPVWDRVPIVVQIEEAAARAGFGGHLGTYLPVAPAPRRHAGWTAQRRHAGWTVLLAAALAGAAVPVATSHHPAFALVPGLLLVRTLFALAASARAADRGAGSRLDLYEHGLVVVHRGRVRTVDYATTDVRQRMARHTGNGESDAVDHSYLLRDTAGTEVILDGNFASSDEWGPQVRAGLTQARLPGALARLRAGERLEFGRAALTAAGIGRGRRELPWAEVEELVVKDGLVTVRSGVRHGGLVIGTVAQIPDFEVFRLLVEQLAGRPIDRP